MRGWNLGWLMLVGMAGAQIARPVEVVGGWRLQEVGKVRVYEVGTWPVLGLPQATVWLR